MYFFTHKYLCYSQKIWMGKRKKLTCHKIQNLKWQTRRLWSVCVREKEKIVQWAGISKIWLFFCFGMKKSLCNKIFCCYSHKNMYEIYLTSFSSLYKDNRNVSLVTNFMWKVVLHTVSHVRVYFPNAWIIFFTVHTDPYFLRLLQSLFCCLAFYT